MTDLIAVFATVFLAELGDKTQLATLLFASSEGRHPLAVFAASASALVLSTGIAVLLGQAAQSFLGGLPLKLIAGVGFIAIGGVMVLQHARVL